MRISDLQTPALLVDQAALEHNLTTMAQKDSPGWYSEVGVHMFFAIRYSVVMNAYYRSAKTRGLVQSGTNTPLSNLTNGQPYDLDLSGIGGRAALCIGF